MKPSTAVGGVALVLIAAAGAWWLMRPPQGFITGMFPIDGERAVFTMRHNPDNGPSQAWIGVVDSQGVQWSHELPDLTYSIYARHGLTVNDGLVTVEVSNAETYTQHLAFDLRTGDPAWQSERTSFMPSEFTAMLPNTPGMHPIHDGAGLLHAVSDRAVGRWVARDPADGSTRWSLELPEHGVREIVVSPNAAIYRADHGWVLVKRSDGSIGRQLDVYSAACMDDTRLVLWGREQLVSVDLTDEAFPIVERPLPAPGIPLTCGTHGGHFVFTVKLSEGSDDTEVAMIGIDLARASEAWRIDLGAREPSTIARSRDNAQAGADPLTGEMADFVPLVLDAAGASTLQLVMVDMQRHALAWEGSAHEELLHFATLRGSRRPALPLQQNPARRDRRRRRHDHCGDRAVARGRGRVPCRARATVGLLDAVRAHERPALAGARRRNVAARRRRLGCVPRYGRDRGDDRVAALNRRGHSSCPPNVSGVQVAVTHGGASAPSQ